jgi:hypothetical protein
MENNTMKINTHQIKKAFSETSVPVIFATDKENVSLSSFVDEAAGTLFISTEGEFFNPANGEKVVREHADTSSTIQKVSVAKYPAICSCESCGSVIRASVELAEQLDGLDIACVSCGSVTEVSYFGELLENLAEEEEIEEDKEEEIPASDDEENEEDEIEEEVEDEPSSDEDDEEDLSNFEFDENEEEEEEETPEEEVVEDDTMKADEDLSSFEFDEAETQEVTLEVASSVIDTSESFSFLARDEALSKVEVFLGNTHLGSLVKDQASDQAKTIYSKPSTLKATVTHLMLSHIADNSDEKTTDDLKAVGFVPATVTVNLPSVDQLSETEKKVEIETEVAKQVEAKETAFLASLEVAMTAVNKGLLQGNSPYVDLAQTLKLRGVVDASQVSRKFVESSLAKFLQSSFEHAKDLAKKDPKYVAGFSQSVEVASYGNIDNSSELSLLNSSILPAPSREEIRTVNTPKLEIASNLDKKPAQNRFSSALRKLGR